MFSLRRSLRCSESFSLLATDHLVQAVEAGAASWGLYGVGNAGSDDKWKSLTKTLFEKIDAKSTPIETVNRVLNILASNNVSIGSFWSDLFEKKLDDKIKAEKLRLSDLLSLIQSCNTVDFRSNAAISKLIAGLLENETVWIVSPDELVLTAKTVGDSYSQNRALFAEISNRVSIELNDFSHDQLIGLLEAFARINFINEPMFTSVMHRFTSESSALSLRNKIRVADAISRLRFRSDTFFKSLVPEVVSAGSPSQVASVCVTMQRLKMNVGKTSWWDRETDYQRMVDAVKLSFQPKVINSMNAKEIAHCVQVVRNNANMRTSNAIMERTKYLLTQDPLSRSHRYLAVTMEALAKKSEGTQVINGDHLRWLAEWLCGNVYILPVHDIATINRAIAKMGFRDHGYHKIWIPYYLERLSELTKEDVALIQDNFNHIGMSDTQMGGRHFFYKLGQRFQELTVEQNGDKELSTRRKFRNVQRLG